MGYIDLYSLCVCVCVCLLVCGCSVYLCGHKYGYVNFFLMSVSVRVYSCEWVGLGVSMCCVYVCLYVFFLVCEWLWWLFCVDIYILLFGWECVCVWECESVWVYVCVLVAVCYLFLLVFFVYGFTCLWFGEGYVCVDIVFYPVLFCVCLRLLLSCVSVWCWCGECV